ncbi:two-component system, OmpR family, phosphate regulon sensor histidine kinase PhoR [Thermoflexales bacterium]|nr:two-component system, OmpR family, phosphate regulon sensor histidine kinase PhoR [Thermoflexales bacterium]
MENPKIDPARLPELHTAASQLLAALELNELIDCTLQAAIKLTHGARAFIQFPDHSLYAFPQLTAEIEQSFGTALEGLTRDAARNRQGTLIADSRDDPRFAAEPLATLFTARTLLIVPLQARNEFLGALIVDRATSPEVFTAADLATLTFFAGWAALAMRSAQSPRREAAFMAEVAHELAHPLTSIKGYTDLLLKKLLGPLNAKQVEFLETVSLSTNQMRDLLNDLLDIGRLETRRLRLEIESIDLREYAKQVVGHLRPDILNKRQTVTLPVDPIPPVQADLQRLVQVMTLLLDNAIKYTPGEGKIDVSIEVLDSFAKVFVRDTGIGIESQDQPRIFQKWFRSADPVVREHPGNGLNLYIAKHLIELMGGAIGFESAPGQGSTFWFTLPLADPDSSAKS